MSIWEWILVVVAGIVGLVVLVVFILYVWAVWYLEKHDPDGDIGVNNKPSKYIR